MINGHVYVEMGDGLKWATCNVGADKPEEVGTLFAWGKTTPKATYSLDNYKWYRDGNYTKYNSTDGKQILSEEDDAATAVNLGAVGDKACRSDGDQRFMTLRSTGPGTPFTTALSVNCQKVQPSKSGLSFS